MTRLTLTMFLSLDGVYQAPGEPGEDRSGGFDQGGWQVPYVDEEEMALVSRWFLEADAFLFGRRTYEIFAGYWPRVTDESNPIARRLNELPKCVASKSLSRVEWRNATLVRGDVVQEVHRLKSRPGRELQMHGSGELAQTLIRHGLVDELRLLVHPVVLGRGKRLFPEGSVPSALRLTSSTVTRAGVLAGIYAPAGRPAYGDFALEALGERGVEAFERGIIGAADEARRRQGQEP